jgi:peptide/nickel transport system substrate-binding protein
MPLSSRHRVVRSSLAFLLGVMLLLPAAVPAAAADEPLVLRVGTTQELDSLNPYATILVSGYETFQLTYNLLVDFGPNLEPVPGFADKWERAADGKSWTFHIREGMKWSDGTPATAQDACFSWQLNLDANKADDYVGEGYINPGLNDAQVTDISCPDDQTMVVTTNDASERVLQTYVPILPKHIWGDLDYQAMGDAKFKAPLVGTGPYIAEDWQTSQFVRFKRNPYYWGTQGAADEVVIQFYENPDTMVQALKAGEIDYARDPNPDQLKALANEPNITTVAGAANGWTQLAFNTYGTGTGKTIKDGGPSTKALLDPAFRDALGYAIDKPKLVDSVLGGFGDVGTTVVPPVIVKWHVEPDNPRHFDIDLAKQKLDAAGYVLDSNGNRLDKQGKPIKLRLFYPKSDTSYQKAAAFVKDWYGQLGIQVTAQVKGSTALGNLVLPPEACPKKNPDCPQYRANYDIELWGWSWGPDPNQMLQIFRCDYIGSSSDSQYCNPAFDALYDQQAVAQSDEERHAILAQMQNLIYDEAPYDVLYYDANRAAYRTDRFTGWQNQPLDNGTPLFTYSTLQYTLLKDATAPPPSEQPAVTSEPGTSAAPATTNPGAPATPAATASGGSSPVSGGGSDNSVLIIGILIVIVVVGGGGVLYYRRRSATAGEEEE